MADKRFPTLPGFRDFAPRDCAIRNYLYAKWRAVARKYGFVEYEAPLLEATALYQKKAGEELNSQLFRFEDQGGRDVTLRPELTASLARMVCANQRDFPKPMKWFEIGPCFRYESPQKGRGREFIQFNADIIGEDSAGADAELIALSIETMIDLGFTAKDFEIRASDRQSWLNFCEKHQITDVGTFLQVIDKIERDKPEVINQKLTAFHVSENEVRDFIADSNNASDTFKAVESNLESRGLGGFLKLDLTIVRGLAYYTGIVFEIFDSSRSMRAVAGGGRYNDLIKVVSDGAMDIPCTGFAMGDMVIRNFIEETPNAALKMESWLMDNSKCDVYVMIAAEEKRPEALGIIGQLRQAGIKVDFPLSPVKFNKQFKKAEESHARFALIVGEELPELKLKILSTRTEESLVADDHLVTAIVNRLAEPDGPLLT